MVETPVTPTQQKRPRLSGRAKTIIAIVIIALAVVLAFFAPPEGDSTNTTGDLPNTPTVSVTNQLSVLPLNRQAMLGAVQLTLTQVTLATKFSDDRRPGGVYVVRVLALAHNTQSTVVGVNYANLVRLQLPDGTIVAPKLISVAPASLPKSTQSGFFDFPVSTVVNLSQLTLHLGNTSISFGS